MGKYIGKRLLLMIPVVIGVAITIFTIMYFVPGDPAQIILGTSATEADLAAKRTELGLDQPYLVRLGTYLSDIFLHGNFGKSYINNTPITQELLGRLPRTLLLGVIPSLLRCSSACRWASARRSIRAAGWITSACSLRWSVSPCLRSGLL